MHKFRESIWKIPGYDGAKALKKMIYFKQGDIYCSSNGCSIFSWNTLKRLNIAAAVLFALMARIEIIQNPYLLNLHYYEVYGILRKALWFAKESEQVVAH